MMDLPTNKKGAKVSKAAKQHQEKLKKMVEQKDTTAVSPSVRSLTLSQVSLSNKIKKTLRNTATPSGNKKGGDKSVKDLKKHYGWTWKRSLKIMGTFGIVLLIGLVILAGVGFAFAIDAYQKVPLLNPTTLQAKESSIVYLKDGKTELFRLYGTENRKNVTLADIPIEMQYAIIGLEEKDFYKQDLPWFSIIRAVQDCALSKLTGNSGQCAGGSGLAQQLYRNATGDKYSNIMRKIRELFAAKKLLDNNTKDQILELYLNWVPFGKNTSGVGVASEVYFGKPVKEINLPQACFLASLPQNPANFENGIVARNAPESPSYVYWKKLMDRKNICLGNLLEYDIKGDGKRLVENNEKLEELKKQDLAIVDKKDTRKYPHFQDYVEKELKKVFPDQTQLQESGFKIVTTLDPIIQDKLDAIYDSEANLSRLSEGSVNNAAAVILDGPTGNIIAMRGSMGYNNTAINGQVNMADAPHAPGSTFKAYDYTTLLMNGFNPGTTFLDVETDFGNYKPRNFSQNQNGPVTLAYALQNSLNIPAVKSAYLAANGGGAPDGATGMANIHATAEKMGVVYPNNTDNNSCKTHVTSSLGSCDVNMLSHAVGFNTLAQDGNLRTATPFLSITIEPNKVRTQEQADAINANIKQKLDTVYPKKEEVIPRTIARQMDSILSDTALRWDAFGSTSKYLTLDNWNGKIAAKTGTATGGDNNQATNIWTGGFSKKYTVMTWAGNSMQELIPLGASATGIYVTAPTWKTVMEALHEGLDPNSPEFTFSTEGLARTNLQCVAGVKGGGRCSNDWISPEQQNIINVTNNAMKDPAYNPFEKTIFENRNEIFTAKRFVNKIDRKVANKDQYPAEYMEEIECLIAPSAFPTFQNWKSPASRYGGKEGSNCFEKSAIDPNAIGVDITSTPAIGSGITLSGPFTLVAKGRVDGQTIKQVNFKVDGTVVDSAQGNTLTINPIKLGLSGARFVVVEAIDAFDKVYPFNYSDVTFPQLKPFEISDIGAGVVCSPASSPSLPASKSDTFNCSFVLPSDRSWSEGNNVWMSIGNEPMKMCTYSIIDKRFACSGLSAAGVNLGSGSNPKAISIKVALRSQSTLSETSSKVYLLP